MYSTHMRIIFILVLSLSTMKCRTCTRIRPGLYISRDLSGRIWRVSGTGRRIITVSICEACSNTFEAVCQGIQRHLQHTAQAQRYIKGCLFAFSPFLAFSSCSFLFRLGRLLRPTKHHKES
ncbi:hypothetical protein T440DRAFT_112170 [Plenodomus tracheiphilus IPT5]|uniref:C2H2-type domain-containing protein n=1 Tax=Plenodomus tracheiphilus IPT5 TaxID=1408161 RepID=A0A6A7B4G9_9PLEO|nr:hypothetical protein T440DRAFT_112170 [Plenodomus tracheiphilus IPT5]